VGLLVAARFDKQTFKLEADIVVDIHCLSIGLLEGVKGGALFTLCINDRPSQHTSNGLQAKRAKVLNCPVGLWCIP